MSEPRSPERSITVIVPALNEEGNLPAAVSAILSVARGRFARCEILLFDDGSTDQTGRIADALSEAHVEVQVFHNRHTRGLGYCYRRGVEIASCEYVIMVPGDNEVPAESLALMFDQVGTADIVAAYFTNTWVRPRSRRILSGAFTSLVNGLFGIRLHYFNGPCIHRRELALLALPSTSGFAYMAVLLARLVTSGYTVTEVGLKLGARSSGRSKALRPRNFASVGISLISLFIELRVLGRRWRLSQAEPLHYKVQTRSEESSKHT